MVLDYIKHIKPPRLVTATPYDQLVYNAGPWYIPVPPLCGRTADLKEGLFFGSGLMPQAGSSAFRRRHDFCGPVVSTHCLCCPAALYTLSLTRRPLLFIIEDCLGGTVKDACIGRVCASDMCVHYLQGLSLQMSNSFSYVPLLRQTGERALRVQAVYRSYRVLQPGDRHHPGQPSFIRQQEVSLSPGNTSDFTLSSPLTYSKKEKEFSREEAFSPHKLYMYEGSSMP